MRKRNIDCWHDRKNAIIHQNCIPKAVEVETFNHQEYSQAKKCEEPNDSMPNSEVQCILVRLVCYQIANVRPFIVLFMS
jgi:hypothetical protein